MQPEEEKELIKTIVKVSRYTVYIALLAVMCIGITLISLFHTGQADVAQRQTDNGAVQNAGVASPSVTQESASKAIPNDAWKAPDMANIPSGKEGGMIRYGRDLIAHTANFLGPKGSVAQITNGMNCQNCHLDAGTKFLGNNYSAVWSTYPKFRARSGTKETVVKRVSDCFERSLNGKAPDSTSREINAIVAYIKFLGIGIEKGSTPNGAGLEKLAFLDRAADPAKGSALFQSKCASCHGGDGQGVLAADQKAYTYPPLWGKKSYNDGAGLYRLSSFAGYIKNNMPLGATAQNPTLTNEEAWDIAAFVNSQSRPHKNQKNDWKDISKKPIDFPLGPYADQFSEKQHKYGPFKPIKDAQKTTKS